MTKLEYLKQLEDALKNKLNRNEINEIMRDYAEYFVEGHNQGKSDYEIATKLGEPKEVARNIITEGKEERQQQKKQKFEKKVKEIKAEINAGDIFKKIMTIALVIIALPFLFAGVSLIGGVLLTIVGGAGAIAFTMFGFIAASIMGFVMAIMSIGFIPNTAVMLIVMGVITATLASSCVLILMFIIIRGIFRFIGKQWSFFTKRNVSFEERYNDSTYNDGYEPPSYDNSAKEGGING